MTLSNKGYYLLPYDRAIGYIKEHPDTIKRIYAPMICDPSHFYLAKSGIVDKVYYFRKIWADIDGQNLASLYQFCRENNFDYVMFPRHGVKRRISYQNFYERFRYSGYTGGDWFAGKIREDVIEELFQEKDTRFTRSESFKNGKCELAIFRVL